MAPITSLTVPGRHDQTDTSCIAGRAAWRQGIVIVICRLASRFLTLVAWVSTIAATLWRSLSHKGVWPRLSTTIAASTWRHLAVLLLHVRRIALVGRLLVASWARAFIRVSHTSDAFQTTQTDLEETWQGHHHTEGIHSPEAHWSGSPSWVRQMLENNRIVQ